MMSSPGQQTALIRAVRFSVNLGDAQESIDSTIRADLANGYGGWPRAEGPSAFHEFLVTCVGPVDGATGYLASLADIDREVRAAALPALRKWLRGNGSGGEPTVLARIVNALKKCPAMPLARVTWRLTPTHAISMEASKMDSVVITQQLEFSAAHVLHVATLSAEENRRIFGKCNNPHGHGHNYRIEVGVAVPVTSAAQAPSFTLETLERIVLQTIIARFDHKHLNIECPEFATLNPSIENITRTCHDLLTGPLLAAGGKLSHVRVWETDKTSCTYPAAAAG